MKFHDKDRLSLIAMMNEGGFSKEDFHFIKRKGRIITQKRISGREFSYFLKKEVELDPVTSDFIEKKLYELRIDGGSASHVNTWNDVLDKFRAWLKNLS